MRGRRISRQSWVIGGVLIGMGVLTGGLLWYSLRLPQIRGNPNPGPTLMGAPSGWTDQQIIGGLDCDDVQDIRTALGALRMRTRSAGSAVWDSLARLVLSYRMPSGAPHKIVMVCIRENPEEFGDALARELAGSDLAALRRDSETVAMLNPILTELGWNRDWLTDESAIESFRSSLTDPRGSP